MLIACVPGLILWLQFSIVRAKSSSNSSIASYSCKWTRNIIGLFCKFLDLQVSKVQNIPSTVWGMFLPLFLFLVLSIPLLVASFFGQFPPALHRVQLPRPVAAHQSSRGARRSIFGDVYFVKVHQVTGGQGDQNVLRAYTGHQKRVRAEDNCFHRVSFSRSRSGFE